jgi:choice-of-anchor C domain-containing protein
MKKLKTLALACAQGTMLVCLAAPAHAELNNLITNGSFEDGNYSGQNYSWLQVNNGQSNITGWSVGGAAVDWHNSAEFSPIQDGERAVDLNLSGGGLSNTGTISQTFSTEVNATYSLDFYFSGPHTGFPDPRQVRVKVAGDDLVFSQVASSNNILAWGLHTYTFKAIDTSTTLTFSAVNGSGYWGALIDDVSVNKVNPPSPFRSHAAIAGGAVNIAASSTVNGDLAAQAAVVIGANSVVHNIYAGAAVTTGALSKVENIFSGAAAGVGANAHAQNIHAGAAITLGADGDVQAVYAGAAITKGAGAETNGTLAEDANADEYAEAGDIHNSGNMADVIALITDTQSALSDLEPSSANPTLSTTMGTRTLAPGVWEGDAVSIAASSTITFDADEGSDNTNHVWVINLSEALTVGASTNFEITGLGNGDTATIIWNVGAALNLGAGTSFRGTAFVGGAVNAATSSVSCGHLYATGAISIGSIGVENDGSPATCENSDAVFTYLETLD